MALRDSLKRNWKKWLIALAIGGIAAARYLGIDGGVLDVLSDLVSHMGL